MKIHFVPTEPEYFGKGSPSRLNEQNNTHAKMRVSWSSEASVFLVAREVR